MRITWHGHSCFELGSGGYSLVLDPYYYREARGYLPLRLRADAVLCSHEHYDHNCREAVELRGGAGPCPFETEELATFHDVLHGRLRGENTVRILRAEGLKVAHLGDLGCRPSPSQLERLRGCDALMIPVGGILTIDAAQAWALCEELSPRVILPMHYGGRGLGNRRLAPPEEFTGFCPGLLRVYDSNSLELTADTPRQVALFALPEGTEVSG